MRFLGIATAVFLATAAHAQGAKPPVWNPTGNSAPAPVEAYDTLRTAPGAHPLPFPEGVTRTFDLEYQPAVPDSMLPLVLRYRELSTEEQLTTYVGALRLDAPPRPYPIVLDKQTVHVAADGLAGQGHLAIVVMVPWFGEIGALPGTTLTVVAKVDNGPEQKWKLLLTPGPNLYIPAQRPVPVSNPTLITLPLAPGKHRVTLQVKDLRAAYAYLLFGQPVLSPPAISHQNETR
jgi:hypothetical protein